MMLSFRAFHSSSSFTMSVPPNTVPFKATLPASAPSLFLIMAASLLRGTIAIGGESAGRGIAASIRLRGIHAGGKLREEREVATVQRKVIDAALVDNLADRGVLTLQYGRG